MGQAAAPSGCSRRGVVWPGCLEREGNPDDYFINSERNPGPGYVVLHRAGCPHFTGNVALHWTKDYVKFCSPERRDLEEWAAGAVGGEATLCRTCFG